MPALRSEGTMPEWGPALDLSRGEAGLEGQRCLRAELIARSAPGIKIRAAQMTGKSVKVFLTHPLL